MRKAVAFVVLLIAGSLAGCMQEGDQDGMEIEPGDFVRVHYVGRYQSNGTVFTSTVNGTYPEGTDLTEVPFEDHLEAQLWLYMWKPSLAEQTGRNLTTNVRFRDANQDGFRESMFRTTADVSREGDNLTQSNRNISYYDIPLDVIGDPNVPGQQVVEAFYDELQGHHAGDVLDDVVVPPEKGFGAVDPDQIRNVTRILEDRPRNLTNQSRAEVEARSNLSEETDEGDRIGYDLFNETRVDARVTNLSDSQVDLYLLVEANQTVQIPDLWDATVLDVNATSYDLRHEPEVGETYRFERQGGSSRFRVVGLNPTEMRLDFNDPRAGETLVYDIKVVDVVRPDLGQLFRGTTVDPFRADARRIRDVALLSRTNLLIGTGTGIFVTFNLGERWYPFTFDTLGATVEAIETGTGDRSEIWASVDGRLWHTDNVGYNWTVRSPQARPVVDVAQPPTDGDVVYALVKGSGIYRSDDRGRSWSKISDGLTQAGGIAAGPSDTSTVWAATGSGLRRSTDQGETWSTYRFEAETVGDVAAVDDHTLYATVGGNLTVSTDGGDTWERRAGGTRDLTRFTFARDDPSRLVATNRTNGLVLSLNGGRLWPSIRQGQGPTR